jgi:hypothetical protein
VARWLGRLVRAIEQRTAAPLPARLRSRAPRFPPAQLERAIFRRGTFELAWSVPCHARFFHKYIPRRLAMPPEPVQVTERRREPARSPDYVYKHGFRGPSLRRCCFQRRGAGSDAAGVGGFLDARSVRRPRRASCDCHSRTFARAPDRRPARGYLARARSKTLRRTAIAWRRRFAWMRSC